jgi:hypothetical protein
VRLPPERRKTETGTVWDQIDKSAQRENAQQWNKVAEENRHEMQEKSAAAKAGKPAACCALM